MLIDIDEQIWILCSKDQETPHIAHVEYQLDVSFWCTQFLTPYRLHTQQLHEPCEIQSKPSSFP